MNFQFARLLLTKVGIRNRSPDCSYQLLNGWDFLNVLLIFDKFWTNGNIKNFWRNQIGKKFGDNVLNLKLLSTKMCYTDCLPDFGKHILIKWFSYRSHRFLRNFLISNNFENFRIGGLLWPHK